ncbi:MAG: hypothetical protein KUF77_07265 [Candidatus Thiodiazotropha sp. (ex Lucina aurantia)]|nr:hypothetical protein [Candidatus Thiodiazotropha taylori]MBV2099654.1 hypothetical protein [Candidatus Thiodiazotropha sp. (ex Codakia orbicularis)]MBV2102808.1 hypothetical protein [Candidatus Thiodiazotropha sp. (ex Lucina aurantia)]MBV2117378.1 hypothetical protein [Candidatus Thiodiazotropha sp. (ex Lucina aurantia)]
MEAPIRVAWIDDKFNDKDDARTKQAQAIIQAGGNKLSIELIPSTDTEFLNWVNRFSDLDKPQPEILILDFKLAQSPEFGGSFKLDDGYKLGKMLELTPLRLVPKYLVSAVFNETQVGPNTEGFEWILANPVESELVSEQLISDGSDYRSIYNFTVKYSSNSEEALKLLLEDLVVPEGSIEEVVDLIHHALGRAQQSSYVKEHAQIDMSGIGPKASALNLSRWLRGILLIRLGPLIDSLTVANILGADQEWFSSTLTKLIEEKRPTAIYKGLFSQPSSLRWWRSEIINWILESFDDITPGSISQLAPCAADKLKIPDENRSRCAVCGDLWPDVVAYDVDDPEELRQVHRYCSEAVEDQEIVIGFDEIRSFTKD